MSWLVEHRVGLFAGFLGLCVVENVARVVQGRALVSRWHYVVGTASWLIELALRAATLPLRLAVFTAAAALVPWHLELTVTTGVVAYLTADLIYYLKHRWYHSSSLGWALHAPHHSPTQLSLISGVRLGWVQRQVDDLFFLPLVLFGLGPELSLAVVLFNELWPFWLHTETVDRLPGWWEQVFNSPRAHHIHHSRDAREAAHNYASTLMLWDRLGGTLALEPSPAHFGVADLPHPDNPLSAQFWVARTLLRRWLVGKPVER